MTPDEAMQNLESVGAAKRLSAPRSSVCYPALEPPRLQELLSDGQWTLDISGDGLPQTLGPDKCKEFKTSARESLTFSHARWVCIYDVRDRVIEWDENTVLLEVTVPSGAVKLHRWSRVAG